MAKPNPKIPPSAHQSKSGPTDEPSPLPTAVPSQRRYDTPGDEPLSVSNALTLNEPFRFDRGLSKRLRMREVNASEAFTLRDSVGVYYRAALKEYDGKGGVALPYERMPRSPESSIDLTLACAVLARHRMHLVVQKATELGVRRIVPLMTDCSVPPEKLDQEQAHAWPSHILRATKQCRRSSVPHLLSPTSLDEFLASPLYAASDLRLFLDDRVDPAAPPIDPPRKIILLVGPEGGFSDREVGTLHKSARPWVLGGRILRAETAVLVGLTAAQMLWGDFRT